MSDEMSEEELEDARRRAVLLNLEYVPGTGERNRRYQPPEQTVTDERPSCFAAGTRILTPAGWQAIEHLRLGDYVVGAHSGRALECCVGSVLSVQRFGPRRLWLLQLSDGRALRTTAHHRFYDGKAWRRADRLVRGDSLVVCDISQAWSTVKVVASHDAVDSAEVHNLVVERVFTYVADGMLAHSFSSFPVVQTAYWTFLSALQARGLRKPMPCALNGEIALRSRETSP